MANGGSEAAVKKELEDVYKAKFALKSAFNTPRFSNVVLATSSRAGNNISASLFPSITDSGICTTYNGNSLGETYDMENNPRHDEMVRTISN